jgi:hypothetical protein
MLGSFLVRTVDIGFLNVEGRDDEGMLHFWE